MKEINPISLSFDIGHSSIGWAVLSSPSRTREDPFPEPTLEGCGSVLFPKDDCLASARRGHRRMRRNIRATRQRIDRLKKLLLQLDVLTAEKLDAPGHPAPHVLAAKALLSDEPSLSWLELWHLLRWYAHNRGYDGNSRWSRQESDDDGDTEKEKAALELMQENGTKSMAATICAVLKIDLSTKKTSSHHPYKNLNAAFPRKIVRREVLDLLEKHRDHLPKLDQDFIETLVATDESKGKQAWRTIPVPDIKLPRRHFGGLLFGQLIPRFDNRIIAKCPISGTKVPNKASLDFLRYRWAMIIANLRADGKPLTAEQRQELNALMEERGRLTGKELRLAVEKICATVQTNCSSYFEIHPDSADALILDPALALYNGEGPGSQSIKPFWQHLSKNTQQRALGRWKKGRPVSLQWMMDEFTRTNHNSADLNEAIEKAFDKSLKNKNAQPSLELYTQRTFFAPKPLSGRAPYARQVMQAVVDFVLTSDRHPTEKETAKLPPGPIYRSAEILKAERDRPIEDLTNNHLIRQRLTILLRLTDDLIANYADNNPATIQDIVVEVARDLQEYSGLTAQEMSGELTKRLSHFKSAVKYLEENAPDLTINGSLIRKCRIAMDMEWKCPFTGKKYDAYHLKDGLEREHIIPYADRPTNSLDSLVLTFSWVNALKGKRTARQFINDMADDDRFLPPKQYATFVEKLKVAKKATYPDDFRRQSNRKKLMMVETYEAKDHDFTQGALTQTSHLNRLSARQLEKRFADPETGDVRIRITSIPGQVTGEIRKSWKLLGTLTQACPECADKTKTEIRNITHLHHALDAATLAFVHHYLPGILLWQSKNEKGAIWIALLKRNKTPEQVELLLRTRQFKKTQKRDSRDPSKTRPDAELIDLPTPLKNQLAQRLIEQRAVQHIPADQSGAGLQQNAWRVIRTDGDDVTLIQRHNRELLELVKDAPQRQWKDNKVGKKEQGLIDRARKDLTRRQIQLLERGILKIKTEKTGKLVGLKPGKLQKNKSVLIIEDNYGLALDPEPQIIPLHNVPARLAELRELNGGNKPRILRNGMLISLDKNPPCSTRNYTGVWRIASVKNNKTGPALDLVRPSYLSPQNGVAWAGMNKRIQPLLNAGLLILTPPLTGITPSDSA